MVNWAHPLDIYRCGDCGAVHDEGWEPSECRSCGGTHVHYSQPRGGDR